MRVLFYVEPLVERENPVWKKGWVEHFVKEISSALITEGLSENDIACIVPSALEGIAHSILPNSHVATIDQTELIPRFGQSALVVASGWYLKNTGSAALSGMAELVCEHLGDFVPTLCLTFSPAPFLKLAWPEVKVLHMEYGFISRPPFPETMYFDPRGMFAESILAKYKDELQSWYPPDEAVALLTDLRHKFQASKDNTDNPVASIVSPAIESFESAVLLALQFSNFYAYDANARFPDQYDLLIHTLDSLPSNIAVIVCEHPEHPVLRPETVEYLNRRYPNFIWHPLFRQVYGVSHYLMPFVQGVITVSSSVGLQALLWKKHLAIVGEGHLGGIADTQDVGMLPKFLNSPWNECRDRLLCWLLSNYHLPFSHLLNSGRLREYLNSLNGETPAVIEEARLSAGLSLDEIRLAYDIAWRNRPVTPYGTVHSTDPNNFVTALYVATEEHGYDELHCIRQFVSFLNDQEVSVSFRLEGANSSPVALRFDPANSPCAVWLSSLTLRDGNGDVLWTWCGEESGIRNCLGLELLPQTDKVLVVCYDNDPQFELIIDYGAFSDAPRPLVLSANMAQSSPTETAETIKNLLTGLLASASAKDTHQFSSANQTVAERDALIANLNRTVAERDALIANLNRTVAERDALIANLNHRINTIFSSKSWKATMPLRYFRRVATWQIPISFRNQIVTVIRRAWRTLPLSIQSKQRLKSALFTAAPFLFRHTVVYKDWLSFQNSIVYNGQDRLGEGNDQSTEQYVPLLQTTPLKGMPAKLICFYLPQFHPIPENNAWWGEGFTEWANVQPAKPQFEGHYQPHVPGELGYYSLLDPAIQQRQVELAKLYGIGGFCFYFYWFGGKRLLETPIENYLNDSNLDLPFCLCWANENWSRRWDGLDKEILIAQEHSPADDLAFISHVANYMRDSRYIRIDGKPLLLVYRPSLLPSAKETAQRWRDWCKANGLGEIYLAYTQSFETIDPADYGFDAAIEFPPNNSAPPNITDIVKPSGADFGCTVYDWRVFVERSKNYTRPAYQLFRSVCPSWDNTARRKNRGTVFLNSTPALYQQWLENAVADTLNHQQNPDERLIFVNAWNEWAEGAHLEPDAKYGYAWLQATRDAISGETYTPDSKRKVILVAHDAYPHGAQMLAANLAKTLNQGMGFHVDLVCLGKGPLIAEYAKWATVHMLAGKDSYGTEAKALASRLYGMGHRSALVNTTVSGLFLQTLVEQGIECVALIHELRGVIEQHRLHDHAQAISTHASKIVFPAAEVAKSFKDMATVHADKLVIRPQGLYKRRDKLRGKESDRILLRQKLELPKDAQIVLGVGYADYRKGVDLFVAAGIAMANRLPNTYWVWIGHWEQTMQHTIEKQLAAVPELKNRFIFPGLQQDTDMFYGGADVFALTSREDPFPSVVLEAMDAGVPMVGFEDAGGFIGLLCEGCGRLVEKENETAFGEAVATLLEQPEAAFASGARGAELIAEQFSFRHYVFDLLDLMGMGLDRISVVLPNYNYAHYLPERLNSILRQDYPIFEILFLDDHSTDESLGIAKEILSAQAIDYRIVPNTENSGSVFKQWMKGVNLASGTHVWIAEADDSCDKSFLSETRKGFRTPGVVLSYCESQQIDESGQVLADNYLAYVSEVDNRRWLTPFVMDGDKAAHNFCIKNVIPNVSAALFRTDSLRAVLNQNIDHILSYRVAGDWLVYALLLKQGLIAFTPVPANAHRRHQNGVTLGSFNTAQLEEIRQMQAFIMSEFSIPVESAAAAQNYADKLAKQFGLAAI